VKVLVIDVGGTHVKLLLTGEREPRLFDSGQSMTASRMVKEAKGVTLDWSYSVISIGYPGLVVHGRIAAGPRNLGRGWVGFDFARAFGRPVKFINDAAMQALGSHEGGRKSFNPGEGLRRRSAGYLA
jgi:polyphosphate glucokinase